MDNTIILQAREGDANVLEAKMLVKCRAMARANVTRGGLFDHPGEPLASLTVEELESNGVDLKIMMGFLVPGVNNDNGPPYHEGPVDHMASLVKQHYTPAYMGGPDAVADQQSLESRIENQLRHQEFDDNMHTFCKACHRAMQGAMRVMAHLNTTLTLYQYNYSKVDQYLGRLQRGQPHLANWGVRALKHYELSPTMMQGMKKPAAKTYLKALKAKGAALDDIHTMYLPGATNAVHAIELSAPGKVTFNPIDAGVQWQSYHMAGAGSTSGPAHQLPPKRTVTIFFNSEKIAFDYAKWFGGPKYDAEHGDGGQMGFNNEPSPNAPAARPRIVYVIKKVYDDDIRYHLEVQPADNQDIMSYADTHTFTVCKYKGKGFDLGVKTSGVGKFAYFNDLARTLFSTMPHTTSGDVVFALNSTEQMSEKAEKNLFQTMKIILEVSGMRNVDERITFHPRHQEEEASDDWYTHVDDQFL